MIIRDLVELVGNLVAKCLAEEKFTGKITITIHCRDGGIGRATSNIERDFVAPRQSFFPKTVKYETAEKNIS